MELFNECRFHETDSYTRNHRNRFIRASLYANKRIVFDIIRTNIILSIRIFIRIDEINNPPNIVIIDNAKHTQTYIHIAPFICMLCKIIRENVHSFGSNIRIFGIFLVHGCIWIGFVWVRNCVDGHFYINELQFITHLHDTHFSIY